MVRRSNYNNWQYDDSIKALLDKTILDSTYNIRLDEAIKKTKNTAFYENHKNIYEDLAKFRFVLDLPNSQIADIYNLNIRSIEQWLKIMGWNRNRFESQQLAAKKSRDYTKIRRNFKKTMVDRFSENGLFGSKVEQYVRYKLNSELAIELPDHEIIVGVNNMSCINEELDIPIIIISHNNNIFKYAVEVDGKQFHEEPKKKINDYRKSINSIQKGYSLFRIRTCAYYSKDDDVIKRSKADEQINEIISFIKYEVENNITSSKNIILL